MPDPTDLRARLEEIRQLAVQAALEAKDAAEYVDGGLTELGAMAREGAIARIYQEALTTALDEVEALRNEDAEILELYRVSQEENAALRERVRMLEEALKKAQAVLLHVNDRISEEKLPFFGDDEHKTLMEVAAALVGGTEP